ncbi:MAG: DUF2341 domain-containing protein, partial [Candidatus Hodarchaeota archaeon]
MRGLCLFRFSLRYFKGNKGYRNTIQGLLLGIICLNFIILAIPTQNDSFLESDDIITQMLKGFGLEKKEKQSYHVIPKLSKDNLQDSNSASFNNRFRLSSYYVPGWADTRFSFRKNITIDATKVSDDLIDFPVLIDLYDSDLQQDAQASGNDIMFSNAIGHILDHEIEFYERVYNSTHAHLVAWVKTNLSGTQDAILSMYYGNPTLPSQENPISVWNENYIGVWHLDESTGGTDAIKDSTSNLNDGTDSGNPALGALGQMGNAIEFDGTDDYIDLGTKASLYGITNNVTISAWIYPSSATQLDDARVAGTKFGYELYNINIAEQMRFIASTDSNYNFSKTSYTKEEWTYFVGIFDGTETQIFKNGALADSDSLVGSLDTTPTPAYIGGYPTGYWWNGIIDEVRISSTVRSTDWIQTEYNNQDDPSTFYLIGEKECSPDYWAFNSFKYRKQITIDATKVSADLTNFPVLIDLYDADLHDSAKVQADGDDLVFTTSSGIKLDHELELFNQTFNSSHAHLIAWVRIPNLSSIDDTDILMYYGNEAVGSQTNPTGVWTDDFKGVWHLSEDPSGSAPQIEDSTTNNNHGTASNLDTDDQISGQIDGSIDFDNNQDHVDCGNHTSLNTGTGDLSLSLWFNYDAVDMGPMAGKGAILGGIRYYIAITTPAGQIMAQIDDNSVAKSISSVSTYGDNMWHHVVMVKNGNLFRLYIDGVEDGNSPIDITGYGTLDNVHPFYMNTLPSDNSGVLTTWSTVKLDEVRISTSAKSADWIATEYNNQDDPNSFFSVSSEEENSNHWVDGSFRYRKTIVIDKDKVSADLTNFPVLIDLTDSDLRSGKVQSDADDIIFIDQTGAKLDHEIELIQQNSSHGRLIAWIRVPSLSSVSDTNITMYYGNNAVGTQENPEGVWIDYVGVWHLSEASGDADDSTQYDTTATASNMNYQAPGVIGYTFNWDEASRLSMGAPTDGHLDFGTGNFTISFWINVDEDTGSSQCFMFKGAPTLVGYCLMTDDSPVSQYRAIAQSPTAMEASPSYFSFDEWNYIVMRLDRVTDLLYIYSNATEDDTADTSALGDIDNPWPLQFPMDSTSDDMDGLLDEIRLSNLSRTPDWISTEYQNQKDPNSFYSISSEESYGYWWADTSFSKKKDIVIDKKKVSEDLPNFPVLIDLYDADLRTNVQTDAADLLFVDSFNRKLDHEIELFDQTGNGTHAHLIAWVNVPTLFNSIDTLISMYYGNNDLTNQENPEGVWTDYVGVWHLAETTGDAQDSTSYTTSGTISGTINQGTSGVIGNSYDFTTSGLVNIGNPVDGHLDFGTSSFSWSCWIYVDASTGTNQIPVYRGGTSDTTPGYSTITNTGANQITTVISDGVGNQEYDYQSSSLDTWYYIVAVVDRTSDRLITYWNGSEKTNVDISSVGSVDTNQGLYFGHSTYSYDGILDEVRVSRIALSAGWIQTEYNNQHDPTSFYDVGSEYELDNTPPILNNFGVEDPGTGTGTFWADITDAHSSVDSALIKINGTEYSMSPNGTHWIIQLSVSFNGYYVCQIVNASDAFGNYLASPSNNKSHTFNLDNVSPNVLDWIYINTNNTFQANVTDSWGEIDMVFVNVTESNSVPRNDLLAMMVQYSTFGTSILAYMNDTLVMDNGPIKFQIIVNDTSGNEFLSSTHSELVYDNTPPVASAVTLSRDEFVEKLPIFSNSTLYLDYTFYDEEGHSDTGTKIWWYKDSGTGFTLQPEKNDSQTINGPFTKGDQWYATVEPHDSAGGIGDQVNSTTITIQNTPPQASNVQISPSNPTTVSTLNISYVYSDPYDGDPQNITLRILEWYRNGSYIPTFDNQSSISAENTTKGETWYYRIRVYDGTNHSSWTTSSTVVIGNSPPLAENLTITTAPTTIDDLTIGWDYVDLDNDSEITNAAIIEWWETGIGHIIGFDNVTTLPAINTSKGQTWYYKLK